MSDLRLKPITFRAACAFVEKLHRHNKPPRGHKFSIGLVDEDEQLVGVAMVGRPIARAYDDGWTCEVNRTCTDGTRNANSKLYGAAWRAAKAMGYQRIITYTQADESGASLKAAGFVKVADRPARGSWAQSSLKLKDARDPVGNGGVDRCLWHIESEPSGPSRTCPPVNSGDATLGQRRLAKPLGGRGPEGSNSLEAVA